MRSPRVVFLDFDGVLNSLAYIKARGRASVPGDPAHSIDPAAIAYLNEIVQRSGAVVVISSSWREMMPLDGLRQLLARRGFVGMIVGKTPSLSSMPRIPSAAGKLIAPPEGVDIAFERGHEIQAWIDVHGPVESFVILDDHNDMVHLMSRLVQTHYDDGLQARHIPRALSLLATACPRTAAVR